MPMFTEIDPWRDEDYWPKNIGEDSLPKAPGAGLMEAAGIEPARHSLPKEPISRRYCYPQCANPDFNECADCWKSGGNAALGIAQEAT